MQSEKESNLPSTTIRTVELGPTYAWCHTCAEISDKPANHINHSIEYVEQFKQPTLKRPNAVYAVMNIFDCYYALQISLGAALDIVDGFVFIYGPYRQFIQRLPTDMLQKLDEIEAAHFKLIQKYCNSVNKPFKWIVRPSWETEMEKREIAFDETIPFSDGSRYKTGDYLLLLDSDEIIRTRSRTALKDTLMFCHARSVTFKGRREPAATFLDEMDEINVVVPLYQRGYEKPKDTLLLLRIFQWHPHLAYGNNHYTVVDKRYADEKGRFEVLKSEMTIYNFAIIHAEDLVPETRMRAKRAYYNKRAATDIEKERDADQY